MYKIDQHLIGKNAIPDKVMEDFNKVINDKIPKMCQDYKPDIKEIDEKFKKNSTTTMYMYKWAKGAIELWEKQKQIRPLEAKCEEKKNEKNKLTTELEALTKLKDEKEKEYNKITEESEKSKRILENLEEQIRINTERLERAKKLLNSLGGERGRWIETLKSLKKEEVNFLGNYIVSSLFIAYLSPFTGLFRNNQINEWIMMCKKQNISISDKYSLKAVMSNDVEIRGWTSCGLPNDSVSIENAIMIANNNKYPLLIDPQLQGNQWLKKYYKDQNFKVYKAELKVKDKQDRQLEKGGRGTDPAVLQLESIEKDISDGNLALLENCTEALDSAYTSIIGQNYYDDGTTLRIAFNGKHICYSEQFRIFFTTKISNPHYPPEYFIKLNIINFTVTKDGLSEQLLSEVFKSEKRDKYEARDKAIKEMGENNDKLEKLSAEILAKLAELSEEKMLDDDSLIIMLDESKEVYEKVEISLKTAQRVDAETSLIRDQYVPVALRGSILYFVVSDMGMIDPMYQFSLEYFKKIFTNSIAYKEEQSNSTSERVDFLERKITEDIYKNIKRGLFEAHKYIFSFLIIVNILKDKRIISEDEWSFFIKGVSSSEDDQSMPNPDSKYFSSSQWNEILYLENKYDFNQLSKAISTKLEAFKTFFESNDNLKQTFDDFIDKNMTEVAKYEKFKQKKFLKLLLYKIIKPDKLVYFVKKFIGDELGELFIDQSPSKLEEVYEESDWRTPIIFILSKGADPTHDFISFKERFQKFKKEQYEQELAQKRLEEEEEEKEEVKDNNNENNEANEEGDNANNEDNEDNNDNNDNNENNDNNDNNNENQDSKDENNLKDQNGEAEQNPGEFPHVVISLGQGQEENARKAIEELGLKKGGWILLSNCHLFSSFMQELSNIVQKIQESMDTNVNKNFRLWLTSMPSKNFPVSILQNSLKLTTEPPTGIKANMKKLFDPIQDADVVFTIKQEVINPKEDKRTPEEVKKDEEDRINGEIMKKFHYTKLLFALTLFHSVLQERKKFGPIGFNMRYDFNQSDFNTSSDFSRMYIDESYYEDIPLDSISYLIGDVTYGGSITDETDRLVMNKTLEKFINFDIFEKKKDAFGKDLDEEVEVAFGDYVIKNYKNLAEYKQYIPTLPAFDEPEIFGLNKNANIVYELKESSNMLELLSKVIPKGKRSGGEDSNAAVLEMIIPLINQPLEILDLNFRDKKTHDKLYDHDLRHSLTIVLFQEIDKYNTLIKKINNTLVELKKAIEGTSIMSLESEEIYNSLMLNKVPTSWSKIGYTSFKPFGSWLADLKKRITFIDDWMRLGFPIIYWISGLFYPQGFITGIFQTYARETKTPVNDVIINFHVMDVADSEINHKPNSGVYVNGLYLEGASWDNKEGLVDQSPGDMYYKMPAIWFETTKFKEQNDEEEDDDEDEEKHENYYYCPMFKTTKRAQIISSSGNSVEKVIDVKLRSFKEENYWILRGAALLMQLDN